MTPLSAGPRAKAAIVSATKIEMPAMSRSFGDRWTKDGTANGHRHQQCGQRCPLGRVARTVLNKTEHHPWHQTDVGVRRDRRTLRSIPHWPPCSARSFAWWEPCGETPVLRLGGLSRAVHNDLAVLSRPTTICLAKWGPSLDPVRSGTANGQTPDRRKGGRGSVAYSDDFCR